MVPLTLGNPHVLWGWGVGAQFRSSGTAVVFAAGATATATMPECGLLRVIAVRKLRVLPEVK